MRFGAGKRLRKFFNGGLTDEMIWDEIIEERRLNNIHQLTSLNQRAAAVLIELERRMELLSLGIVQLPEEVAAELVKYQGEVLLLNCVHNLSAAAARAISRFKGFKLGFKGLRHILLSVIKELVPYKGILILDAVEELSVTQKTKAPAEKIFTHLKASRLCLNGLKKPSMMLLNALAKVRGELELSGIKEINAAEASVLVSHKGKSLKLKGLSRLPAEIARIFVTYPGYIDFSGVLEVDEETAKLLVAFPEERILLNASVRKKVDDIKAQLNLEARKKRETIELKKKLEEDRKRKIEALDRELLKEFEEFDMMELTPAEPVTRAERLRREEAAKEQKEKEFHAEDAQAREARLNFEITQKKNRMNELLRKGFDNLTDAESAEADQLRRDINELKDEIKSTLDIMVEERELGAVVFNSSDDLAKYLKDAGEEDDENDALANIEEADMFGDSFSDGDMFGDSGSQPKVDMFGNLIVEGDEPATADGDDGFFLKEI